MINKSIWLLFSLLTLCIIAFFLTSPIPEQAGDIVEYYGITESISNHASIELTHQDQTNLSMVLNSHFFQDNQYYIPGINTQRYPVHFIFYSFLLLPVRMILKSFQINELYVFSITNTLFFSAIISIILKFFIRHPFKQFVFLTAVYLSPLIFFLIWPGPDIFYLSLLLLTLFLFFNKNYWLAAITAAIASWQSSPLIIIPLGIVVWTLYQHIQISKNPINTKNTWHITISAFNLFFPVTIFSLLAIPYIYNYSIFGVLSPWTILPSQWTLLNGVGIQNINLLKLFEQFFDFNIGIFWWAPLLFLLTLFYIAKQFLRLDPKTILICTIFLISAVIYQINPSWHNGTAGYGPGRYSMLFIPLFIYSTVTLLKPTHFHTLLVIFLIITQLHVLSLNNFLRPYFPNSNKNTPLASFILDNYPALYNPTPEIFIDRTSHTDLQGLSSAIYKKNGKCKKAFILKTDVDKLVKECGPIPEVYKTALDDEFGRKANFSRKLRVETATFWPDDYACSKGKSWKDTYPYICMRTKYEVIQQTNINDEERIQKVPEFPGEGIWKLTFGKPIEITIPPGYFIHYTSLEGIYVTY